MAKKKKFRELLDEIRQGSDAAIEESIIQLADDCYHGKPKMMPFATKEGVEIVEFEETDSRLVLDCLKEISRSRREKEKLAALGNVHGSESLTFITNFVVDGSPDDPVDPYFERTVDSSSESTTDPEKKEQTNEPN